MEIYFRKRVAEFEAPQERGGAVTLSEGATRLSIANRDGHAAFGHQQAWRRCRRGLTSGRGLATGGAMERGGARGECEKAPASSGTNKSICFTHLPRSPLKTVPRARTSVGQPWGNSRRNCEAGQAGPSRREATSGARRATLVARWPAGWAGGQWADPYLCFQPAHGAVGLHHQGCAAIPCAHRTFAFLSRMSARTGFRHTRPTNVAPGAASVMYSTPPPGFR